MAKLIAEHTFSPTKCSIMSSIATVSAPSSSYSSRRNHTTKASCYIGLHGLYKLGDFQMCYSLVYMCGSKILLRFEVRSLINWSFQNQSTNPPVQILKEKILSFGPTITSYVLNVLAPQSSKQCLCLSLHKQGLCHCLCCCWSWSWCCCCWCWYWSSKFFQVQRIL